MSGQYLVDKRQIDVTAHMIGEFIILFFFKLLIIKSCSGISELICKRFEKEVYKRRVVKDTMDIGSHTSTVDIITIRTTVFQKIQRGNWSIMGRNGSAHVNFITGQLTIDS